MQLPRTPLILAAITFVLAVTAGTSQWQAHFRIVPILRVRIGVPAGQPVPPASLEVVHVPAGGRPEGAVTAIGSLAGRWTRVPLVPGETLLESHLTTDPPRLELADRLQPGRMALSIPVRSEAALQGALRPGDLVDVWSAFPATDANLEQVRVLAVRLRVMDVRNAEGARAEPAADLPGRAVPAAVLLEVGPDQATVILTALTAGGEIYLLLSGHIDLAGVPPDSTATGAPPAGPGVSGR